MLARHQCREDQPCTLLSPLVLRVLPEGQAVTGNSNPDRKLVKSAAMRTSLLFGRADVARANRRARIGAELHGRSGMIFLASDHADQLL